MEIGMRALLKTRIEEMPSWGRREDSQGSEREREVAEQGQEVISKGLCGATFRILQMRRLH